MESLLCARLCSRCLARHSRQGRQVPGVMSLIIASIAGGNSARKKVQHAKGESERVLFHTRWSGKPAQRRQHGSSVQVK